MLINEIFKLNKEDEEIIQAKKEKKRKKEVKNI
jgi:hypothetical protein